MGVRDGVSVSVSVSRTLSGGLGHARVEKRLWPGQTSHFGKSEPDHVWRNQLLV